MLCKEHWVFSFKVLVVLLHAGCVGDDGFTSSWNLVSPSVSGLDAFLGQERIWVVCCPGDDVSGCGMSGMWNVLLPVLEGSFVSTLDGDTALLSSVVSCLVMRAGGLGISSFHGTLLREEPLFSWTPICTCDIADTTLL